MDNFEPASAAPSAESAPAPASHEIIDAPPQATGEPGAATQNTEPTEPPQRPESSRIQKRIDELTKARYDEQRRAEEYAQKLAEYERRDAIARQFQELNAQEPQIDQFQSLAEYQRAMAAWTANLATAQATAQWEARMQEQRQHEARAYAQAVEQQQRQIQRTARIEEKMAEGVKKYPDFHQVLMNPELPAIGGTPLEEIVLRSEHAVDIGYALAKNPAQLERLLAMHPVDQMREVLLMDTKFAGNGATNAPPPPPTRTGSAQVSKDWSEMSTKEHVEAYHRRKRS